VHCLKICEKCKRPELTIKDFQEMAGKAYLIAIADQEFLKYLKEVRKDESV